MKKKRIISLILATTMAATVVVSGCGKSGDSEKTDDGKKKTEASDDKVLEFYHGYYQDASEWAPAQVMRDIYDEFAKEHADGEVEFKAIPITADTIFRISYQKNQLCSYTARTIHHMGRVTKEHIVENTKHFVAKKLSAPYLEDTAGTTLAAGIAANATATPFTIPSMENSMQST